jgi:1-deoxy-D-xylulose-5-phosphate synthase
LVITVEDGIRDGGVGMQLADAIGASPGGAAPRVVTLGVPAKFIPHGKPDRILARLGLDADGIVKAVREQLA